MRKLLLVTMLVAGFAAWAYAEDVSKVTKQVTAELQDSGVITAKETPSVAASVKTLVKNGATAQEAKSVVSQAVKQAKEQGLKGRALSAKVNEAVKARKAQMNEAKKKAKEAKAQAKKKGKEAEAKANKDAKELQKKLNKKI
ncbi:MAG: hypothetical protein PHV77_07270 [Candidatus Omnitrophica bacterium]|nr:hypothetical protein [Candidatus Omnitrophota bacterium]